MGELFEWLVERYGPQLAAQLLLYAVAHHAPLDVQSLRGRCGIPLDVFDPDELGLDPEEDEELY